MNMFDNIAFFISFRVHLKQNGKGPGFKLGKQPKRNPEILNARVKFVLNISKRSETFLTLWILYID